MNSSILTQIEVGQRVHSIRKNHQFSQKEVAEMLDISRSSLTQIELGKRNMTVIELIKLADVLDFSIDNFLSKKFDFNKTVKHSNVSNNQVLEERISVPDFNYSKTVPIFLYILSNSAARIHLDEKMLFNLIYLADFNHYEVFEEQMTGAAYYKILDKPHSHDLKSTLLQMEKDKLIKRTKLKIGKSTKTTYFPLQTTDFKQMKASELYILQSILQNYKHYSSFTLLEYVKGDMPLEATENNELIDYELVFYRDTKYSVRTYEEED